MRLPENIRQCMQDVHQLATEARDAGVLLRQADDYFVGKREAAKNASSLHRVGRYDHPASHLQGQYLPSHGGYVCISSGTHYPGRYRYGNARSKMPKITTLRRYDLCSVKRLQSKEDIDRYVDGIREAAENVGSCDGVPDLTKGRITSMNKGAIQRFAIWARNELIAQVSQRAYQYGITKEGCGRGKTP